MNHELQNYINDSRRAGVHDGQIKQSLLDQGWEMNDIETGLATHPSHTQPVKESEKSYLIAVILSFFLGIFAAERFYLGRIPTAIIKLLTIGGLGIWALIDMILVTFGVLKDKSGLPLQGYSEHGKIIKLVFGILAIAQLVIVGGIIAALVATTFNGINKKALDAERLTDLISIQQLLEKYYNENGQYPTLEQLNEEQFRMNKLGNPSDVIFSEHAQLDTALATTAGSGHYGYQPSGPFDNPCDIQEKPCIAYKLTAKLQDGSTHTKQSLNGL